MSKSARITVELTYSTISTAIAALDLAEQAHDMYSTSKRVDDITMIIRAARAELVLAWCEPHSLRGLI